MDFLNFIKSNVKWLTGGLILTVFSSFGQTFFVSLFTDDIHEKFNLTDGQFGALYMVATLVAAASLVFLGKVVDRFSIANVAVCVIVSLATVCAWMSVLGSVVTLFVCLFAIRLLGQGMMTHVSQTAMGRWYDEERGRAISLTSLGHNLGEAIFPAAVLLVTLSFNWQTAWQVASLSLLVVALPIAYFCLKDVRRTKARSNRDQAANDLRQWTRHEVTRDLKFYLILVGLLAPAFITTSFYFHQKHLLEAKGWPESSYASAFFFLAITSIAAKLTAGWMIDRWGAVRILPLFLLPLGLACFVLAIGTKISMLYAAFVFVGLAMGFCNSTLGALWPEIYGVKHLGAIRSIAFAGVVVASALGPGLTGFLIDIDVAIENQFIVMGIYCFVALGLMVQVSLSLSRRVERTVS